MVNRPKAWEALGRRMAEEISPGNWLALLNGKGVTLYSNLPKESLGLAREIAKSNFPLWDIGDYQVKSLGTGRRLLVYKATADLALALESLEREGIVLVMARRLAERYRQALLAPSVPVPPAPQAPPSEGEELSFTPLVPEAVPCFHPQAEEKVLRLDSLTLRLLKAVDGRKSVAAIAQETGIETSLAGERLGYLTAAGLLTAQVPKVPGPEDVYELAPHFGSPEEALLVAGPSLKTRTIILNLDRGYTVTEITRGLQSLGIETDVEEVLQILENLRARGVVILRG